MNRLAAILLVFLAFSAEAKPLPFATVILLDGEPRYAGKALNLGQSLPAKGTLECGAGASVHLVLSGGASLVLEAGSALDLSRTALLKGTLGVLSDSKTQVHSFGGMVDGKGAFILSLANNALQVDNLDGEAQLWIGKGPSTRLAPLERARIFDRRLEKARRVSKREAGELKAHWQRSILIHGQREQLLKHYLKKP